MIGRRAWFLAGVIAGVLAVPPASAQPAPSPTGDGGPAGPQVRSYPREEDCRGVRHTVVWWPDVTVDMEHPDAVLGSERVYDVGLSGGALCFNGQPTDFSDRGWMGLVAAFRLRSEVVLVYWYFTGTRCLPPYVLVSYEIASRRIFTSESFGSCGRLRARAVIQPQDRRGRANTDYVELSFGAHQNFYELEPPSVWRYANGELTEVVSRRRGR